MRTKFEMEEFKNWEKNAYTKPVKYLEKSETIP